MSVPCEKHTQAIMITQSSGKDAGASKQPKRSLFNKPAWAKIPSQNLGDEELFRRSGHAYVELAAEADRERKKKLAKKKQDRSRQDSSKERSSKRMRLYEEEDDDDSGSEGTSDCSVNGKPAEELSSGNADLLPSPQERKTSLAEQYESAIARAKIDEEGISKAEMTKIIDIEDEDDSPVSQPIQVDAEVQIVGPPTLTEDTLRDEEFPELAQKAREKARRKRLQQDVIVAPGNPQHNLDEEALHSHYVRQPTPPPPPPDPVLRILITSSIENTKPLIVNRKLSQRLKDVRLAWAEHQGFAPDFADTVFLTWRGKRLFDVTSCKSLGIDANGRVQIKGDVLGDEEGRIHMEAMTPEILEAHKRARNDAKTREEGDGPDGVETTLPTREAEAMVKIILKAKGFEDFKLIVKPVSI